MDEIDVSVVCCDADVRLAIARALDDAPLDWHIHMDTNEVPGAHVVVRGPDSPGPGIDFDAAHPERLIADIEAALSARRSARIVAVVGASGGCGTTTIALHLAAALAPATPTIVVETETRCGLSARLCLPDSALDRSGDAELSELPVAGGFRVSLAPDEETPEDLHATTQRLARKYGLVIVDVGTSAFELASASSAAVLVMPATHSGMSRGRARLEEHSDLRWATVVNRVGPGSDLTNADLERILGHEISVQLPCTPTLRDLEDHGRLLAGRWTRWNRLVQRLARVLAT